MQRLRNEASPWKDEDESSKQGDEADGPPQAGQAAAEEDKQTPEEQQEEADDGGEPESSEPPEKFSVTLMREASAELSKVEILESRLNENKEVDPYDLPDEYGWPVKDGSSLSKRGTLPELMKRAKRASEVGETIKEPSVPMALASKEDRQLAARAGTDAARRKARLRVQQKAQEERISADVGTGPASPSAFVHIEARPGPEEGGPEQEAANLVVSRSLGITLAQANKLLELGSVWAYDEYYEEDWIRVQPATVLDHFDPVRVFPNPERCQTCYVEDWDERIKKVDRDFVVVDKPPLLPCLKQVCNSRESLSECLREALHLKKAGGFNSDMLVDMPPCSVIDDEATGLVVLARHEKAGDVFAEWVEDRKVSFEFVAIVRGSIEKGIYRHFYQKAAVQDNGPLPALFDEPPEHLIEKRSDYDNWAVVEMEVLSTAELEGGCSAVRIQTSQTWYEERIRAQLAMLGAPVLNDEDAIASGTKVPNEVATAAGLLAEGEFGASIVCSGCEEDEAPVPPVREPLGGAVHESVLHGPYGAKLQLLPAVRRAAANGVSQKPRKKMPVALHLARVEFGGRVVTCAPPKFWPEFAAAAVAVKLTAKDKEENIFTYLSMCGGKARIREVGGRFSVRVEFLEEHFPIDRSAGLVFATEDSYKDWQAEVRVKSGKKAWMVGIIEKGKAAKERKARLRDTYLRPGERKRTPTYKQIKKGKVKPVTAS